MSEYLDLETLHAHVHQKENFFPGQRETEIVKLVVRRHWLIEVGILLRFALIVIAPILLIWLFGFLFLIGEDTWQWILFALGIYLLLAWLHTYTEFLKNKLSVLVVTNERIVDVIQSSLFSRQVSETGLNRIQDVIGFTKGILGTFLDVGNLEIQTAGREITFISQMIKSPHLTARRILNVQRQAGLQRRTVDTESRRTGEFHKRTGENLSEEEIRKLRNSQKPTVKRHPEGDGVSENN